MVVIFDSDQFDKPLPFVNIDQIEAQNFLVLTILLLQSRILYPIIKDTGSGLSWRTRRSPAEASSFSRLDLHSDCMHVPNGGQTKCAPTFFLRQTIREMS